MHISMLKFCIFEHHFEFLNTLFHKVFVNLRLVNRNYYKYYMIRPLLRKLTNHRIGALLFLMMITSVTAWGQETIDGLTYNTSGGYYEINVANDLSKLADYVNGTWGDSHNCAGLTFKLTADIEVGYHAPIGKDADHPFCGTFDGNGHSIVGYNTPTIYSESHIGIFGYLGSGAMVKDLSIDNYKFQPINFDSYIGGIAGFNAGGTVRNCQVMERIQLYGADNHVGRIVGCNDGGTITGCISYSSDYGQYPIYGVNINSGTVSDCYYYDQYSDNSDFVGATRLWRIECSNNININGSVEKRIVTNNSYNEYYIYAVANSPLTINTPDNTTLISAIIKKYDDNDDVTADLGYNDGAFTMPAYDLYLEPTIRASWDDGTNGTEENPYLISTTADLNALASMVNDGTGYYGKFFKLTNDIDYTSATLDEDGNNFVTIGSETRSFDGNFDGANHTIKGICLSGNSYVGIFGKLSGTIKNLTLVDAQISGYYYVGGIAGRTSRGIIQNCHVAADVTISALKHGSNTIGGIVGQTSNNSNISYCTSAATVTSGTFSGCSGFGGIVGYHVNSMIENCLAVGTTVKADSYVGAIVGNLDYYSSHYISGASNNFYHGCTVTVGNNGPATSGIGIGSTDGNTTTDLSSMTYSNNNYTNCALSGDILTVTLSECVNASGTLNGGQMSSCYGGKFYTFANQTITLNYGGEVPEGKTVVYAVDGSLINGNSFTMPAKDVSVKSKWKTSIGVEVVDPETTIDGHPLIIAGDDAHIKVTMTPADFNGVATVNMTFNDNNGETTKHYTVAIVNGEGHYYVTNLAQAAYYMTASFEGNDNYTASTTETATTLEVCKVLTELRSSLDKNSVYVGEEFTVTVDITEVGLQRPVIDSETGKNIEYFYETSKPLSIDGVCTIKVMVPNDTLYEDNYTAALIKGNGSLTFSHFPAGIRYVNAVYAGTDKYIQSNSQNETLTINKIETNVNVEVDSPVIAKEQVFE